MKKKAMRIVFYSPKGGSGKSTGVAQVAGYLAYNGLGIFAQSEKIVGAKTLIIDADPSYNASQSFYMEEGRPPICYTHLMKQCLTEKRRPTKEELLSTIVPAFSEEVLNTGTETEKIGRNNLFIAPSRLSISDRCMLELDDFFVRAKGPNGKPGWYTFFDTFFKPIYDEFNFIIIDAPGQITGSSYLNAICMADFIISPSETDIYSTNAILEVQTIRRIANELANHKIDFLGFYFSRYDGRRGNDRELLSDSGQMKEYLETSIKNLSIIPQLQGRKELVAFDAKARRALREPIKDDQGNIIGYEKEDVFEKLTTEILRRLKKNLILRQYKEKKGE